MSSESNPGSQVVDNLSDEQVEALAERVCEKLEVDGQDVPRRELLKAGGVLGLGGLIGGGATTAATGMAKADASTTDSDGDVGKPTDRVDVFAQAIDSEQLSVVDTGGTSRIAQMQVDGAVVPVAPGLGAEDAVPISNANPVNDAIADVDAAGGGFVVLPNETVTQANPVTAKGKVGIRGNRGASIISIDSTASALFQTDGVDVRSSKFEGFELAGQGVTSHQADCIVPNGAEFIDCTFRHLRVQGVQGRFMAWGTLGGFQNTFEQIRVDNVDAGAENALIEWDGANEAPISLRDISLYPDDSASLADSRAFVDSQTTAGSATVTIEGYLNIGGTTGEIIRREYNEYTINGYVNWEPGTLNSTPAQLFHILRSRDFKFNASLKVQGTTTDVFSLPFNSGLVRLPTITVTGTVNGDLLDVGGQSDTIVYEGVSTDVNNTSGGALSPGVACLGDLTLVT